MFLNIYGNFKGHVMRQESLKWYFDKVDQVTFENYLLTLRKFSTFDTITSKHIFLIVQIWPTFDVAEFNVLTPLIFLDLIFL